MLTRSLCNWAPRTCFISICKAKYWFEVVQIILLVDKTLMFLECLNYDLEKEQAVFIEDAPFLNSTVYGDLLHRTREEDNAINQIVKTHQELPLGRLSGEDSQERRLVCLRKRHRLAQLTSFSRCFLQMLWTVLIGVWDCIFFFFSSSVDDISKTTFPINSRKLYLEFSNEISELLIFKKTKTHEVEFLSYNVPFLWVWYNFGNLSMTSSSVQK